ncbi:hypothetical protein OH76DRAFT_445814 [Lentinus brumalis]|uniref:Uncharacterized protein n=1 Tax=Lentinus brumalis TaxID=2498619 RepID=A0A371DCW9_9APHY|nr:hypothetical protein OH76DRAFT_445814 [Polyporus brumalis]
MRGANDTESTPHNPSDVQFDVAVMVYVPSFASGSNVYLRQGLTYLRIRNSAWYHLGLDSRFHGEVHWPPWRAHAECLRGWRRERNRLRSRPPRSSMLPKDGSLAASRDNRIVSDYFTFAWVPCHFMSNITRGRRYLTLPDTQPELLELPTRVRAVHRELVARAADIHASLF